MKRRGIQPRRDFLKTAVAVAATGAARWAMAGGDERRLLAGEGVVDITQPLGAEMGGFHRPPGKERRITSIRQPSAVRALVLKFAETEIAVCSLDVAMVSQEMAARVRSAVARQTGIPAANVRVCATHTHSMPGFCFLRQWGAIPQEFMAVVEQRTVEAVRQAKDDLAAAEVALGKSRVKGGNYNRTAKKTCKTDERFTHDSSDDDRWLDTTLQALLFHRAGKRTLLWYHFSAHAVCFSDEAAGPDWPGMVAELLRKNEKLQPSFLQGHCGDVDPGNGGSPRNGPEQTVQAIYLALQKAIASAVPLPVDRLRTLREPFSVPLDMALLKSWLQQYQKEPEKCVKGPWVDAGFAADWFRANAQRDLSQTHLPCTLSAVQLGEVALLFHPGELYSYYGLAIRRDSPSRETLVVGYTDGLLGYLCDPKAYQAGEYAAVVVPKILDNPPFAPTAARQMTAAALAMLNSLHNQV